LDKPAVGQPVDEAADGDGFHLDQVGELLLRQARLLVELQQDDPLRAAHAVLAGAPVGMGPDQAGHVENLAEKGVVAGHAGAPVGDGAPLVRSTYNKQGYYIYAADCVAALRATHDGAGGSHPASARCAVI